MIVLGLVISVLAAIGIVVLVMRAIRPIRDERLASHLLSDHLAQAQRALGTGDPPTGAGWSERSAATGNNAASSAVRPE